jgi:hypothetical protein
MPQYVFIAAAALPASLQVRNMQNDIIRKHCRSAKFACCALCIPTCCP